MAQSNCSYDYIYESMVGFARLLRAHILVETMKTCPSHTPFMSKSVQEAEGVTLPLPSVSWAS